MNGCINLLVFETWLHDQIKLCFNHSHKKRKDSLETQAVYIEIFLLSLSLPNGPKHPGSILRNMTSSAGNELLAGSFHAIMDKIEADILQIANTWNWL